MEEIPDNDRSYQFCDKIHRAKAFKWFETINGNEKEGHPIREVMVFDYSEKILTNIITIFAYVIWSRCNSDSLQTRQYRS